MALGFLGNSMLLTRREASKNLLRSRYCAKSGSSTTMRAMDRYGFSTQKRCLKVLGASNLLTRWRKFASLYSDRAGIEGTFSQGVRAFGLRQARYRGLGEPTSKNWPLRRRLTLDGSPTD